MLCLFVYWWPGTSNRHLSLFYSWGEPVTGDNCGWFKGLPGHWRRVGHKVLEEAGGTAGWTNDLHVILPIINGFPNKQTITLNILTSFEMDKSNPICGNGTGLNVEKWWYSGLVFVFGEFLAVVMSLPLMVLMTRSRCWLSLRSGRQLGLISRE